jgi:hypothetical protein
MKRKQTLKTRNHEVTRPTSFHRRMVGLQSGLVIPLVLLAILGVAFMVMTLTQLTRSNLTGLQHSNARQICFQIAFSGCSRILAMLQEKPWSARMCKTDPFKENGVSLSGGSYDSWVENTPGKPDQVDISILAHYAGKRQFYFWRVRHYDTLLNLSGRFRLVAFSAGDPATYPGSGGSGLADYVDGILADRATNRGKSEETAALLVGKRNVAQVARILGARPPIDPPIAIGEDDVPSAMPRPTGFQPDLPAAGNPAEGILAQLPKVTRPVPGAPDGKPRPVNPPPQIAATPSTPTGTTSPPAGSPTGTTSTPAGSPTGTTSTPAGSPTGEPITGGGCFVGVTPVWTPRGFIPIGDLQVGDEVFAGDETTGKVYPRRILEKYTVVRARLVEVRAGDERIVCSDNHPFFSILGTWTQIASLTGAAQSASGPVNLQVRRLPDTCQVHNLKIADTHSYFVGKSRLLVHNASEGGAK